MLPYLPTILCGSIYPLCDFYLAKKTKVDRWFDLESILRVYASVGNKQEVLPVTGKGTIESHIFCVLCNKASIELLDREDHVPVLAPDYVAVFDGELLEVLWHSDLSRCARVLPHPYG